MSTAIGADVAMGTAKVAGALTTAVAAAIARSRLRLVPEPAGSAGSL